MTVTTFDRVFGACVATLLVACVVAWVLMLGEYL